MGTWWRLAAFCWAAAPGAAQTIPLCPGLTLAGVVSEPEGDYELLLTVASIDSSGVHLRLSAQVRSASSIRNVDVERTVRRSDLATASLLMNWFNPLGPRLIAGTTAFGASTAVLRTLKQTGRAQLGIFDAGSSALPADRGSHPNVYDYAVMYTLHRVDSTSARVPVIVNDVPVELPVVRARGENVGDKLEVVFLDDERNPLGLAFRLRSLGVARPTVTKVLKISFPCASQDGIQPEESSLERALLTSGRAEVYDIYFDFNSAGIRRLSARTLDEIARLLARHPEWKLAIEGHTDAVASERYNLELSRRRALAIKQALTTEYHVAPERLTTAGFGEALPKDRNDTEEGRARNRRVELVRLP
ncbi:MAG: OmpA family protein [Gemmatimonadales bacterium]